MTGYGDSGPIDIQVIERHPSDATSGLRTAGEPVQPDFEGRPNVLIAAGDDVRAVIEGMLDSAGVGAQIVHAIDTETALSALGQAICDCAIVDASLPAAQGMAVLHEVNRVEIATPVILIEGSSDSINDLENLNAIFFDTLVRADIENGRLARCLRNAVRVARAERQANLAEQFLLRQSLYDSLTGLPNRKFFHDRLAAAITIAQASDQPIAVLIVDLNRFGDINKTLGHAIGDLLLEEISVRLREAIRSSDTVARLAGDEFAIMLTANASLTGAINAANKVIESLKEPLHLEGHRLAVGASIGIALYPAHGVDPISVVRNAGLAMTEAKRNNSGCSIFAGSNPKESLLEMSLASDLHHACDKGQLLLHYQPVISMETNQACGAEALLRWRHPEHGLVSPAVFIPVAERTGEIEQLTLWVLDSVLHQSHIWQQTGHALPISVNISAVTLHNPDFSDQVATLFRRWGVPVDRLKLEITESAIISDVARATETVTELHRMGVKISIDDFGTGYTSIAYLRRLPVVEVKVDKSYVLNMKQNNDDTVIVRSIIELAHNLGLNVVAEGVEDRETLDVLSGLGCDSIQGFYFGRPMDAGSFEDWLNRSRGTPGSTTEAKVVDLPVRNRQKTQQPEKLD
jgi:diguanylate cyclase (GGDEF)-like protein